MTAPRHIPALDGLRGVAILAVLILHIGYPILPETTIHSAAHKIIACGWVGVDLFFVLSGFLITGILLDTRASSNHFRSFYARRTLRIFPLYYAVLSAWFVVHPAPLSVQSWFWTYTSNYSSVHVAGLSHFWSLAVEEQFYLVWPLVVYFTPVRWLSVLCVGVASVALFSRLWLAYIGVDPHLVYRYTPSHTDALALGALVAVVWRTQPGKIMWHAKHALTVGAACLSLILLRDHGMEYDKPTVVRFAPTALAILFSGAIAYILSRDTKIWLSTPALRSIGKYSYAMYVIHLPALVILGPHISPSIHSLHGHARFAAGMVYVVAGVFGMYLAARISWWAFERHFVGLKDRFAAKAHSRVMEAPPSQSLHKDPLWEG